MNSWIFSSSELARLRKEAATNAKSPLTPEEETTLVRYFSRKIYERLPRFPGKVIPAAVLYLQRFYLYVSPATVSPRDLLLPVVFLSNKLNNNHNIHIDFDKIIKAWCITDPPSVLYDLENMILDTLRFNVDAVTPHEKFVSLVQDMFPEVARAFKTVLDVGYTNILLDTATTTDAALMYTPGEVAIAVLELVLKRRASELNTKAAASSSAAPSDKEINNDILDCNSQDVVEQFNRILPIKIKKFSDGNRENLNKIQSIILGGLPEIPRSKAGEMELKLKCFKDGVPYPPPSHRGPSNQEMPTKCQSFQSISASTSPAPFVPSRAQSTIVFNCESGKSSASPTTSLSPESSSVNKGVHDQKRTHDNEENNDSIPTKSIKIIDNNNDSN